MQKKPLLEAKQKHLWCFLGGETFGYNVWKVLRLCQCHLGRNYRPVDTVAQKQIYRGHLEITAQCPIVQGSFLKGQHMNGSVNISMLQGKDKKNNKKTSTKSFFILEGAVFFIFSWEELCFVLIVAPCRFSVGWHGNSKQRRNFNLKGPNGKSVTWTPMCYWCLFIW